MRIFPPKREQFLLLHIKEDRTQAITVSLDRDKCLRVRRVKEFTKERSYKKNPFRYFRGTVIVSADSSSAFTVSLPIEIKREKQNDPVGAIELENALAQTVGKVFNQSREEASGILKVDELDVVLVGSSVSSFKVHAHHVMNPIGFRAKSISAILELTFTTRGVFEKLYKLFGERRNFFFTESCRAALRIIGQSVKSPLCVVRMDEERSRFVSFEGEKSGRAIRAGTIPWTTFQCLRRIQELWNVDMRVASELYLNYLAGNMSERTQHVLEKIFIGELRKFVRELRALRMPPRVYVISNIPLPRHIPFVQFGYRFEIPSFAILSAKTGITIEGSAGFLGESDFELFAPFFEWYLDKSDSTINHWLRRHLNWLGASL